MKKSLKFGMILPLLAFASCKDEVVMGPTIVASEGDPVEFTLNADHQTRTKYQNDWDATDKQALYWGNYLSTVDDNVKVFCYQGKKKVGTYTVHADTENQNVATTITANGENGGVQWGNEGVAHTFYAFYPAANAMTNETDYTNPTQITARLSPGQDPTTYRAELPGSGKTFPADSNALKDIQEDQGEQTIIYAEPDMNEAIMMATNSNNTYGQPVNLDFHVLADVLDITINGPTTPNTLGGNESNTPQKSIKIQNVRVQVYQEDAANPVNKPISGEFTLDLTTGKTVGAVSGNNYVNIQTSRTIDNVVYNPMLYIREGVQSAENFDHLRVRAFLIPGAIQNLNELEVVLTTDCGEYKQRLGNSAMVSGKIHPVKLGYFKSRSLEFDYSKWMSQLDGNIYISELSLPGTWHSSAERNQGNYAITGPNGEAWTSNNLAAQYNAGIRAFEVHVKNNLNYKCEYSGEANFGDVNQTMESTQYEFDNNYQYKRTITYTQKRVDNTSRQVNITNDFELYNTYQDNYNLQLAFERLSGVMTNHGFVVVELGMEDQQGGEVPISGTHTLALVRTATATQIYGEPEPDQSTLNWSEWKECAEGGQTTKYDSGVAWAMAVSNVLNKYSQEAGSRLYTKQITRNTTIDDVRGKIIVKVNTNATNDGTGDPMNESGYTANTPALFSRWMNTAKDTNNNGQRVSTINLKWGAPIAPYPLEAGDDALRWCFTEVDNIDGISSIANRKTAIDKFTDIAYTNYSNGLHRTWYELAIGGYTNQNWTATNCQDAATQLNSYLYNKLADPTRNACPLGVVLFNYALGTSTDRNAYYGQDLIRVIINNNASFRLNRKGDSGSTTTPQNAKDNTNSSFNADNRNPLKLRPRK